MKPLDVQALLAELDKAIEEADPADLAYVIGALERRRAQAWARLVTPPAPPPPPEPPPQPPPPEPERNLSAKEAARRLGVSRGWIYQRVKTLPFTVRIGRRVLFSSRGIEKYIKQRMGQ